MRASRGRLRASRLSSEPPGARSGRFPARRRPVEFDSISIRTYKPRSLSGVRDRGQFLQALMG